YLLSRLIHHLRPRADGRYLDLGSGTGNYTIAMYQGGVPICGLELSATMLARAKEKAPMIAWHNARAEAIPFASGSFDGSICTFVHHHMADPAAAFREVYRVMKPNARFVILNGTAEQMRHYWLNEYFPLMMKKAIAPYERFVTIDVLESAGFRLVCEEKYDVTPDLKDFFLCCGKLQPERYLDPHIRSGISSFADAPDQEEVARGVQRIADDIDSGSINDVIRKYAYDGGDYMFTVAER
ncbi:MAG TPA: class I SAM-dependent methyltransferase, partial [Candidatus Acidoferrum sp.]|nr:class I SAM-dependent methyltransferase [Candidatus Acidoferrum sp.]